MGRWENMIIIPIIIIRLDGEMGEHDYNPHNNMSRKGDKWFPLKVSQRH